MGRCANCIRLKKECNFFPVDQGATTDQRGNFSKMDTASNPQTVSSQSSPRAPAPSQQSNSTEDIQGQLHYPQPGPEMHHQESDASGYDTPNVNGGTLCPLSSFECQLIRDQAHFQAAPFAIPSVPSAGWSTNPSPVQATHQTPRASPSYWGNTHPAVTYGPVVESSLHQVGATQYASPNFHFNQEHQSWAPPTRSMSFGNIEGMPHQYPYHEMHPQHQIPGPQPGQLPGFHFAPHSQNPAPRLPSSDGHQQLVTAPRTEPQLPLPPFEFQKPWSGVPPGSLYSSAGEQHQQPALANAWYPPQFTNTHERPQYEHPQQFYPQSSHPG
jgi:hypothetical protein